MQQFSANYRGAEHHDEIRIEPIGNPNRVWMIYVSHFHYQLGTIELWHRIPEEKASLAVTPVTPPVSQPPPNFAEHIVRAQRL
jgi:hypothetical protein